MQAIYQMSANLIPLNLSQVELPRIRALSMVGALFLAAALPLSLPISEQWGGLRPLEDSHQDLTLHEVVERFRLRLPAQHKQDAYRLGRTLMRLSERHMVSPGLLLSLIETESSYRYGVVSKAGAVGLMQLLPDTAEEVARRYRIHSYQSAEDLVNPVVNLELGVAYIAYLRGRFGHSVHYLAAYNMGPTALRGRILKGDYELGAISGYVEKIQNRTLELRSNSSKKELSSKERRFRKGEALGEWI